MSRLLCRVGGKELIPRITGGQNRASHLLTVQLTVAVTVVAGQPSKATTAPIAAVVWTERTVNLMELKAEMHAQICSELHELYEAKNADYGDAFSRTFYEYGMVAPLLRMEDKLSRLKSLHRKGVQQIKQESMRDTLIDLANYAIMTVMELDAQEESRWE